jgi:hypothetical protein
MSFNRVQDMINDMTNGCLHYILALISSRDQLAASCRIRVRSCQVLGSLSLIPDRVAAQLSRVQPLATWPGPGRRTKCPGSASVESGSSSNPRFRNWAVPPLKVHPRPGVVDIERPGFGPLVSRPGRGVRFIAVRPPYLYAEPSETDVPPNPAAPGVTGVGAGRWPQLTNW